MLAAVVANFIDSVGEREFDAALMALLRAQGFYDIHFTHGSFEFGKDFIAKRAEEGTLLQYVVQSKAGNLALGEWTDGLGQIELLRHSNLVHPSLDPALPRRAVFVMTGRLAGAAALAAQDFCNRAAASDVPMEIWDRERLIELMTAAVGAGLADRVEAPFLSTVAAATQKTLTDIEIERCSQRWCKDGQRPAPCVLEAALLATELHKSGRTDLSAYVGLASIRAACWHTHGDNADDSEWTDAHELGRRIFATYADALLQTLGPDGGPLPPEMLATHREPAALITHSVRCVRVLEIIALLGLLEPVDGFQWTSKDVAAWIVRFVRRQTAAAAPISDRWAVAIIPAVLLLSKEGFTENATDYLRDIVYWIIQRYGRGVGLAATTADAEAEVRQVLGGALALVNRPQRRDESYLASVVLDLAAFLSADRLFWFARGELRGVKALPSAIATDDSRDQYTLDGGGISYEINIPYAETPTAGWTTASVHLTRAAPARYLQARDRSWEHLAVSAVLRERHFVSAWPALGRR